MTPGSDTRFQVSESPERTIFITLKARLDPAHPTRLFCTLKWQDLSDWEPPGPPKIIATANQNTALEIVGAWLDELRDTLATR